MKWVAQWIKAAKDMGDVVPLFSKSFHAKKDISKAILVMTSMGVYEARLNGERVSDYVLAPGWTSYNKRLQYQEYDVTDMIRCDNCIQVAVGKGWYRSPLWMHVHVQRELCKQPGGLLAQLEITYKDGEKQIIITDDSWKVSQSGIRFSEIYDGEIYDANCEMIFENEVEVFDGPSDTLIKQEGEEIREQERVAVARIFTTPKGEKIVDFGQEVTGYVEISVEARKGEKVRLSFAEVLDKEGNFYNANYRTAKCQYDYTCCEGWQTYHPKLTFYGFRYVRIDEFPGGIENALPYHFTAIEVHSNMERTGYLKSSNNMLNKLFDNVVWGQKDNFLDVPTDCPQRDERWGWTGDAQVFVKTACYNFDVEKFYTKWLKDLAAEQWEDGYVGHIIPDLLQNPKASAAWGDAATICPWEVYMAYGNSQILKNQFESMKKWVDYITTHTEDEGLWTGGEHYGDWLGLDAPTGSFKGSSSDELIASAYYAYSTSLVVKAGKVLGEDVSKYEALYKKIKEMFQERYTEYNTQTECAIAICFGLAKDAKKTAAQLAYLVKEAGMQLKTGFVGTPYLLYALSSYGYTEMAYELLLREEYPSWLYSVKKGATTVWEHWDSIMENGDFWSTDMNSFNHYAYGAVVAWVYSVAAGINPVEETPGYAKVRIAPVPSKRLDWLKAEFTSKHGVIRSEWMKQDDFWRYEIETPVEAEIVIAGETRTVGKGRYLFYSQI